jgi:hypothetical protein
LATSNRHPSDTENVLSIRSVLAIFSLPSALRER